MGIYTNKLFKINAELPSTATNYQDFIQIIHAWLEEKMSHGIQSDGTEPYSELFSGMNHLEIINLQQFQEQPYQVYSLKHPCSQKPGRTWHAEISLGQKSSGRINFGFRLSTITDRPDIDIPLTITRLVKNMLSRPGLYRSGLRLPYATEVITASQHDIEDRIQDLVDYMEDPARDIAVTIITSPNISDSIESAPIDPFLLGTSVMGLEKVLYLDKKATLLLSEYLGDNYLSVYNGGIRTYNPGFSRDTDIPHRHPLALYGTIQNWPGGIENFARTKISSAFGKSLLNDNEETLPSFIRLKTKIKEFQHKNSDSEAQRNSFLDEKIKALEEEKEVAFSLALTEETERRRLEQEIHLLRSQPQLSIPLMPSLKQGLFPNYCMMNDWINACLPGRVILSPKAQKAVRESEYRFPDIVYRSLLLLGHEYRDMRIQGNGLRIVFENAARDLGVDEGPSISRQSANQFGKDYFFTVDGQEFFMDRHIRKASARDPKNCMRIYYTWDESRKAVVIGHLTSHLRNSLT